MKREAMNTERVLRGDAEKVEGGRGSARADGDMRREGAAPSAPDTHGGAHGGAPSHDSASRLMSRAHAQWPKVKLEEVALGIYDGPHATPPPCDTPGYYFLGIPQITPSGHIDLANPRYIAEEDYAKWTKRVVPREGDVIFSYEATLNLYAMIPKDMRCCLGRRMGLVRPNATKLDSRFLYYYFFSPEWRKTVVENTVVGATVDRLPIKTFPSFPITLPPLSVQRRIADILSAYDDLIENNRRRIAILEETARLLYKEWFVRLHFPGNERLSVKDGVPSGWRKAILGNCIKTNLETYRGAELPETINYIDISSVKEGRILAKSSMSSQEAPGRARRRAKPGDVIWSNVRPNLKSYALVLDNESNDVFSTGFTILTPVSIPYSFLYLHVSTDEFVSYLGNMVTGATYPAVRPSDFEQAQVVLPDSETLTRFHSLVSPLFCQCSSLTRQSAALAAARDMLLPRLMKGDVG